MARDYHIKASLHSGTAKARDRNSHRLLHPGTLQTGTLMAKGPLKAGAPTTRKTTKGRDNWISGFVKGMLGGNFLFYFSASFVLLLLNCSLKLLLTDSC